MPQLIAYTDESGDLILTRIAPDTGLTIPEIAHTVVPLGTTYAVLDDTALPETSDYRAAWKIDDADPDNPVVVEDETKKVEIDRERALADLEDWFREMTEPGFATSDGWRLGLSEQDVTLLTGYYVLAKEAAALGMSIPPIIDKDGVPHPIAEIEELTAIMLAYGQRRADISAEYAAKKAAILGA